MSQVKVTAKDGQVAIQSVNNPEYGYIRVEQTVTTMENGWLRKSNRSALIRGNYEDLVSLGYREGQTLPGKIVVLESTTPFSPNQQPKVNPQTGEELTVNGSPIYRDAVYTTDMSKTDVMLAHDRVTVDAPFSIAE